MESYVAPIKKIVTSPYSEFMIYTSLDKDIYIGDKKNNEIICKLKGHKAPIHNIIPLWLDNKLISSSWDSTVILWDLLHGKILTVLKYKRPILHIIVSQNNQHVYTLDDESELSCRSLIDGKYIQKINYKKLNLSSGSSISKVVNNTMILTGHLKGEIALWNHKLTNIYVTKISKVCINKIIPSMSMYIAYITSGYNVYVYMIKDKRIIRCFKGHESMVTSLQSVYRSDILQEDLEIIVSGGMDGKLYVWDLVSGKSKHVGEENINHPIRDFIFDGEDIYFATNHQSVKILRSKSSKI